MLSRPSICEQVDLVVCSPLMRTLETAAAAFGCAPREQPKATELCGGNGAAAQAPRVLMAQSEQVKGRSKLHAAIDSAGVPVLAHEGCRECFGVRTIDVTQSTLRSYDRFDCRVITMPACSHVPCPLVICKLGPKLLSTRCCGQTVG